VKLCLSCRHQYETLSWQCPACSWEPENIDGRPAFSPDLAAANEGFAPHYFTDLAQSEQGNFWFESRNRLLIWAIRKYFPSAQSMLEIGCGTGFVLSELQRTFPEIRFAGSEIYPEGLRFAGNRAVGADLFQMDARRIPFDREFDVIGAFDILEHVEEDEEVLGQMYRAVRPGGGIVVTVPQHPSLWSTVDDYSFHKRRYVRQELKRKAEQAGFRPAILTSFISILLPVLFLSRLRNKSYTDSFDPLAELRIHPAINRAFMGLLSVERRCIQAGMSLPWGGSLLLVAYRERES